MRSSYGLNWPDIKRNAHIRALMGYIKMAPAHRCVDERVFAQFPTHAGSSSTPSRSTSDRDRETSLRQNMHKAVFVSSGRSTYEIAATRAAAKNASDRTG
eukprot:950433-Pleurochrysis_carterae.AAC.3